MKSHRFNCKTPADIVGGALCILHNLCILCIRLFIIIYHNEKVLIMNNDEYIKWQDEVDMAFIQRVQASVTQSCALPFAVPLERIPAFILQAAEWFWLNCDWCSEERMYVIKNDEFCKGGMNKIVTLPNRIIGVHGVYRVQSQMRYGAMGDFSLERMMMSSYSQFGGVGSIGGGVPCSFS